MQLSGIGDRSLLRSFGIETVVDSPNVGRRMLEHRCFAIQFRLNRNIGYNRHLSTPAQQALTGLKYLATHKGPLSTPAYDVIGFFKTSPDQPRPDAQILMAPFSAAPYEPGKELGLEREPGIQAIGYILRPDSEGSIAITSSDPTAPLDIDPNFFATQHDRETGVALFKAMRELFSQSPIADYLVAETTPGPEVTSDDAMIDAALDKGYCGYHAVGTCAMGPADDDVVDSIVAGARCGQPAGDGLLGDAGDGVGQPEWPCDGDGLAGPQADLIPREHSSAVRIARRHQLPPWRWRHTTPEMGDGRLGPWDLLRREGRVRHRCGARPGVVATRFRLAREGASSHRRSTSPPRCRPTPPTRPPPRRDLGGDRRLCSTARGSATSFARDSGRPRCSRTLSDVLGPRRRNARRRPRHRRRRCRHLHQRAGPRS